MTALHADATPTAEPLALYVHFPWCVAKCPYCDFNSHPLKGSLDEAGYLAALQQDLRATLSDLDVRGDARPISSVFFGGGTPSLFSPNSFAEVLLTLRERLATDAEVTMEANPGTTEHSDFGGYRSAGINRLSLGAQSFDNAMLKRLGRVHSSSETLSAYEKARQAGFTRINLDLMYALPQQSSRAALQDLRQALQLAPDHVSWYQLTLEPHTEFYRRPPSLPAEDSVTAMEADGRALLAGAGYERYEVSAYAQPQQRSSHNLTYWTFGDYLGVGAGAHGKLRSGGSSVRTAKPRQPRLYLANPQDTVIEPIVTEALPAEFALNALRLTDGVDRDCYEQRTGRPRSDIEPTWQRLSSQGLMRSDRFAATALGYDLLDSLIAEFL